MPEKSSYAHGQFCWVDLMAEDMGGAKEFYGELFGWRCEDQDTQGGPAYGIFTLGGKQVAGLGQCDESQGMPPVWNSYINVDDCQAVTGKVESLGGKVIMPVMQVMDVGWTSLLQDPTGGMVALWQKNRHIGAQLTGDVGSFCWNELATRDVEKAREFYGKLLGWEFADNPGTPTQYYIIKNQGADNGGLMQMSEQWGDMPPCWSVYFTVADAEAAVETVKRKGGQVVVPPFDIPVGRMAVVADADGAVFDVIKLTGM